MEKITSLQNQKIKNLIKLAKPRERKKQNLIIIEGQRAITEALRAKFVIKELFFCPELGGTAMIKEIIKDGPGAKDFVRTQVSPEVFKKITYAENPDGYLAIAEPRYLNLEESKLSKNPLIIVLESLEKPGNLGAILRTAYAAKVDLIIINDLKTDIYNPNVIRASEGFLFNNQIVVASREETSVFLKKKKIKTFATSLKAKKVYTGSNFKNSVALIIGTESSGLSTDWLSLADEQIKIPMQAGIDSLNVSVSTAIILFEAWRQRDFN